jgi:hypothetical protein
MSRYFMIQSWVGSHENEPDYNGQQCGERNVRSSEVVPLYDKHGNANIGAFSDEALEARKEKPKKKSSLSIQQKILPQQSRVERLTEQMRELVQEYQKGNIDIDEYSMLLSVISAKRDRAIKLLSKAKSVRAPFEIEDEEAISLGKTHVKSEKNFKTNKRIATEGNRFEAAKKPTIVINRSKLSKVADWINNHQFTYFVVCSTIALTAAKTLF